MLRFRFTLVVAVVLLGVSAAYVFADEVEAYWVGRPEQFRQGDGLGYAVWLENGVWNLQVTSPGRGNKAVKAVYTGSVRLDRDQIVGAFQGLEPGKKKKKPSDAIVVHKDKKGFDFRFVTVGKVDGVDFKAGENARTITFTLLTNGDDDPKRIRIGANGKQPEKGTFTLPAHLEKR